VLPRMDPYTHPGGQRTAVTDTTHNHCHPEEVQAFAKRRPADEGSMYSSPSVYYVYIMTNRSKTLYTGVTGDLEKRVFEHKQGIKGEFAARYKIDRLVYLERFGDIRAAIAREQQIKGWLRSKKIALIVSMNPEWKDLSEGWFLRHQYQSESA
jgi:putative endonuclease